MLSEKPTKLHYAGSRRLALCALIALFANRAGAQTRDFYCGNSAGLATTAPSTQPHTGRYVNRAYGYSLSIPDGLSALTNPVGPERGFVIALSSTPRAYLRVDASYDAFYDITAEGVHRRDLNAVRLDDAVLSDQSAPVALAKVAGGRYLTRVQCRGEVPAVHAQIIVLRNREIYRLDLQSTPERYQADVRLLEAMLKTWRWELIQ